MPVRALLVRSAFAVLVLLVTALAAVGGMSLGGSGLFAVVLAGVVAGCLGAGVAREGDTAQPRQAAVDAAWRSAVGTIAVLLVLSGTAVLAGGALTAALAGLVIAAALVRWVVRAVRADRAGRAGATVTALPTAGSAPVRDLTVEQLGQEWLRTSAALAQVRTASARQALADRRGEALDELERRDPAGFARWLAAGATVDSDPARYVSGDVSGDPTAGYDAA